MNKSKDLISGFTVLIFLVLAFFFSSCGGNQIDDSFVEGQKIINNAGIFCKVSGKGEPVIVIHGGPGLSHDYLYPHLQDLAQNHKLIFYDQRACGKSSVKVDSSSITLDNFLKDIDGIRKAFGAEKVHLLAHSWGALLALKYSLKYPEKVQSIILSNSVAASSTKGAIINQIVSKRFTKQDSARQLVIMKTENLFDHPQMIEELMHIRFKRQFYDTTKADVLKIVFNENLGTSRGLLQYLSNEMRVYDYHDDLRKVKTPTLLIYGNYDPLYENAGQDLNFAIPNSELKVLDKCGHFPFIEQRTAFTNFATKFLNQHSIKE